MIFGARGPGWRFDGAVWRREGPVATEIDVGLNAASVTTAANAVASSRLPDALASAVSRGLSQGARGAERTAVFTTLILATALVLGGRRKR